MEARKLPWLTPVVFGVALVVLILDAGGGPGWGASSAHVVLAVRFDHLAASPLYDIIASAVTTLVPVGEPGFRLGLLGALLGACMVTGVVAASRALLPKEPIAGVIAAALLLVAPPVRDAAAFASPALLAAVGLIVALRLALRFATGGELRDAIGALAACVLVIGSAPWLGALMTIVVVVWLARTGARRDVLALAVGAIGVALVVLWLGASGSLPGVGKLGASLLAAGHGSAAIVLGAGLAGLAFGALTALPRVRPLFGLLVLVLAHEIVVGSNAPALLALCGVGVAIIPGGVVRAVAPALDGFKRHALTLAAGVPLVGVAFATGATVTVDDPGSAPRELAHDLVDAIPPGTGVFVATRPASWLAIHHEVVIAGARPDLSLVPPLPPTQADAVVAAALRADRIVGSDAASFGRLDVTRATPRYRGFQLLAAVPTAPTTVLAPAHYRSVIGREQAILLALERARYEGANGRLDAAARAAGLERRFGAADLAVLGATAPSRDRPALFGLVPSELVYPQLGPWVLEFFGDDLAWVAGIPIPALDANAPIARRLHAKWREILMSAATPGDPDIAQLGPVAVEATRKLFVETK